VRVFGVGACDWSPSASRVKWAFGVGKGDQGPSASRVKWAAAAAVIGRGETGYGSRLTARPEVRVRLLPTGSWKLGTRAKGALRVRWAG
jgi:hypothetical protein